MTTTMRWRFGNSVLVGKWWKICVGGIVPAIVRNNPGLFWRLGVGNYHRVVNWWGVVGLFCIFRGWTLDIFRLEVEIFRGLFEYRGNLLWFLWSSDENCGNIDADGRSVQQAGVSSTEQVRREGKWKCMYRCHQGGGDDLFPTTDQTCVWMLEGV